MARARDSLVDPQKTAECRARIERAKKAKAAKKAKEQHKRKRLEKAKKEAAKRRAKEAERKKKWKATLKLRAENKKRRKEEFEKKVQEEAKRREEARQQAPPQVTEETLQYMAQLEAALVVAEQKEILVKIEFLPTQTKFIRSIFVDETPITLFTAANQSGKTHAGICACIALCLGHRPWDSQPTRFRAPVTGAALLQDYDNHGRIILEKIYEVYPESKVKVERTQTGGPRVIHFTETGSIIRCFTHDQDPKRLESGTYHFLWIDEPCPKAHYLALRRGMQKYKGPTFFTLTPISEPWIFDDLYSASKNLSGEKEHIVAFTAFPDENLKSHGGHLEDSKVEEFRADLSEEELEARKFGRWMHLIGRVYKGFQDDVHVLGDDVVPQPETACPWGLVVDPHDRLPFAMAWFYMTPGNDMVFRKEWPDTPFEAFSSCDLTVDDYTIYIGAGPRTVWRIMDPNYGRRRSAITGLSIAEEFAKRGYAFYTSVNDDLATGHKAVQNALGWDKSKPIDALNQPKLYVHKDCRNIRKGFANYVWDNWKGKVAEGKAPKAKPREQYKHFMDCVRYAVMFAPRYAPVGPDRGFQTPYLPIYTRGWEGRGRLAQYAETQRILQELGR